MLEIELGVISGFGRSVEEIRNEQDRILVLLGDGIESPIIDA